jgi:hypothetical protein
MKKKRIIPFICIILVFTAFQAWGQTQAGQGNIKLGPVEVHPSVGLMETFTDNVYRNYDGRDKKSDWITTLSPGLELVLPMRRHSFRIGYVADVNWYADLRENNYVSQAATGSLNFDFPGGLLFTVSDRFLDSEIVRKAEEQPGLSGAADPYRALPFRSNDFLTRAKYSFADRWAAALWYNYYKYGYDHEYDRTGDFDRNLFGGTLFYRFTPKTDLLVEYTHSKVDYPKSSFDNNKNDTAYVGIGFDPSAKINGFLKVGWTQKKYDATNAGVERKFSSFSTQIDLSYNLSPYDVISLKGSRTIEEDVDTNAAYTRDNYSLGYTHILSMNEKISLFGLIGYGKSKFEGASLDADGARKTRDENIYSATVGVGYAMRRWLTWNLSYTYQETDSNFIRYDNKENRVFLKATFSF